MGKLRLVGFSGPPRSGKDTLAGMLADHLRHRGVPAEVHALSLPMRLSVYGLLGLTYTPEHYEAHKDNPIRVEGDRQTTIRQEMIALSEHHVKPRLGHGWWGRALLNRVTIPAGVIVVSDMGFPSEHDVFEESMECAWFHVHRDGHDFSNDSRGYVGKGSRLYNNGEPGTEALRALGRLLNQHGWEV